MEYPVSLAHPTTNIPMSNQMFFENYRDNSHAIFTLKDHDHLDKDGNKYISLKKLYLDSRDPTEYSFAMEIFGAWKVWLKFRECALMRNELPQWREELDVKLRSEAYGSVVKIAKGKSGSAFSAAKYLTDSLDKFEGTKRGRPSKAEVKGELKKQAKIASNIQDDMARLGLTLQEGGKN